MRAQRAKIFEVFGDLQGGNAKKRVKKWSKNKNRGPNIWPDSVKNKTPQRNLADLDLKGGGLILIPRYL
mgnify:FL=1